MNTSHTMPRRLVATATLLLAFGVAGCSAEVATEVAPAATMAPADTQSQADGSATRAQANGPLPGAPGAPEEGGGPGDTRQISRTGSITITVTDVVGAATSLRNLAESMGGMVTSESIATSANAGSSTSRLVLSVPSAKLDAALDEVAKIGQLQSRSTTAKDITTQVVDVEARIRTLRESIARIRLLMDKTGSISAIAQVEAELTQRQSELESLLSQQKVLKNMVEESPITVTLLHPGQADPANPFLSGLQQSWQALLKSLNFLLIALGALLPYIVIGFLAVLGFRAWRRSKRASQPAAPVAPRPATTDEAAEPPAAKPAD